jgi:hypothetical protein
VTVQEALVVKTHGRRDLGLRDATREQRLRARHATMRDVRVRRQADLVAEGAAQLELVEPSVRRELVEGDGLREALVEECA